MNHELNENEQNLISLGVPYVNLSGVDNRIIDSIYESVKTVYSRFPLLKNVIAGFQTIDSLLAFVNVEKMEKGERPITEIGSCNNEANYTFFQLQSSSPVDFYYTPNTIDINTFYRYFIIAINRGRYKVRSDDFAELYYDKITMYHELGHVLDSLLHISNDPLFLDLIASYSTKELGEYANSNNKELVAECFAVYMHLCDIGFRIPGYRATLIKAVGRLINEKYIKLCNTTSPEILDKYYTLNRTFLVKENVASSKIEL